MDRGQGHTLEAIVAALILLASMLFALQATAVTPLSTSTSNQHVENQHQVLGEGLLTTTAENGTLKDALLYWGDEDTAGEYRFHCADGEDNTYYRGTIDNDLCDEDLSSVNHVPPNEFGAALEETFGTGIAANVNVTYVDGGEQETQRLLFQGDPSDNAVRASTLVTLYDDDRLLDSSGEDGARLVDEPNFYADDEYPDSRVYNVVRVEVVVWRI